MLAPPAPHNEPQRLHALRATDILFTPAEERFDRITRLASRLLGTPISVVSLVAEKCQWFKSAYGLDATETPREVSFCGHAILGDDTFVVEDTSLDSRFSNNPLVTGGPMIRSYAGHPLHTSDGNRAGTLCVIDTAPRRFDAEQLEVLRDLAALVETELQRGQINERQQQLILERDELKRKASIDGLTRLWNRTAIMELLSSEIDRTLRGGELSVAMIDIDHFKNVNDSLGHQAGDAVLAEVATRIRAAVRNFDSVGRFGGEEFLALFCACGTGDAKTICERIRGTIASTPIAAQGGAISVTASIGLATFDPAMHDLTLLVGAADAALYRAKNTGRNRVENDERTQ